MTPHVKRWITGVIAVPILFGIIVYGSEVVFAVLIIAISLAGMQEYNQMAFGAGMPGEKAQTMVIALLILLTAVSGDFRLLSAVMSFADMAFLTLHLFPFRDRDTYVSSV